MIRPGSKNPSHLLKFFCAQMDPQVSAAKKKRHRRKKKTAKKVEDGISDKNESSPLDTSTEIHLPSPAVVNASTDEEAQASSSSSEDEGEEGYRIGGYHRVTIGEMYASRYVVRKKLGWGHFSTVWLCYDCINDRHVALKIQKSSKEYTEAAEDEVKLLSRCMERDPARQMPILHLLDFFVHSGQNGNHYCLVFEVMGSNLLTLIKKYCYKGIPLPAVSAIAADLLTAVNFLHKECGIIHTDIKPENILFTEPDFELPPSIDMEVYRALVDEQSRLLQYLAAQSHSDEQTQKPVTKSQKRRAKKKRNKANNKAGTNRVNNSSSNSNNNSHNNRKDEGGDEDSDQEGARGTMQEDESLTVEKAERLLIEVERDIRYIVHVPAVKQSRVSYGVTLVDLGNACWVDHHFTDDIQTRQYRSPEVILGHPYTDNTDCWSLACTFFELATGDLLFEPSASEGWSKSEDHLAQIMELLGPMPKKYAVGGKYSPAYFNKKGILRRIESLRFWPLLDVLKEKYHFVEADAESFSSFLLPFLAYDINKRIPAVKGLEHPFITANTLSTQDIYLLMDEYNTLLQEGLRIKKEKQKELLRQKKEALLLAKMQQLQTTSDSSAMGADSVDDYDNEDDVFEPEDDADDEDNDEECEFDPDDSLSFVNTSADLLGGSDHGEGRREEDSGEEDEDDDADKDTETEELEYCQKISLSAGENDTESEGGNTPHGEDDDEIVFAMDNKNKQHEGEDIAEMMDLLRVK